MNRKRNCYEILGVRRSASMDMVRRAYRRLSDLFEPGNPTLHGLYDEADAAALLAEVRHAYRVLSDPAARREHDGFLFPADLDPSMSFEAEIEPEEVSELDTTALVPSDAVIDVPPPPDEPSQPPGRHLKSLRQRLGMGLEDIADRTKIAVFTLRCMEEDAYADLPAPIYVRGFLRQVGQLLGLGADDPLLARYLEQYLEWRRVNDQDGQL